MKNSGAIHIEQKYNEFLDAVIIRSNGEVIGTVEFLADNFAIPIFFN